MRNLTGMVGYDCIVQAHNRHGWSLPSIIYTFRDRDRGEYCR